LEKHHFRNVPFVYSLFSVNTEIQDIVEDPERFLVMPVSYAEDANVPEHF